MRHRIYEGRVNSPEDSLYRRRDGRKDKIFWRRRSHLFDAFAHCILDLITEQDYKYSEKDLKEISELGWKNE
jgi:hypothetical protein